VDGGLFIADTIAVAGGAVATQPPAVAFVGFAGFGVTVTGPAGVFGIALEFGRFRGEEARNRGCHRVGRKIHVVDGFVRYLAAHVFNGTEEFYRVGFATGNGVVGFVGENGIPVQLAHAVRHADVVIVRPEGLAAFFHQLLKAWVVHLHRNGGGSFDVA